MNRVCSIFSQILQFVPRLEFEAAVKKAGHRQHGFASWDQFGAMMFCQLGHAQSLREITGGLASCEGKLKHLGMDGAPAHSTLAYANGNRPWQLYQDVFQTLLGRCQHEAQNHKRKFRFKNKLLSIDGTMIELSLSVFDWATYKRTKGALKLHMVLDHDGYLPCYAVMTDGKESEMKVAKSMTFQPGTMLVFDRGYPDHDWWLSLTRSKVDFVTRLKDNVSYGVVSEREVPKGGNIIRDEVILLTSQQEIGPQAQLRRIEVWVEERQETLVFVTNNFRLAAKALKQSLKVKTFVGASENAVQIQIWTALIAMLLLKYLKMRSTYAWSFSHLVALIRHQLFVYRDLMTWLNNPFQAPPALDGIHDQQLPLEFATAG